MHNPHPPVRAVGSARAGGRRAPVRAPAGPRARGFTLMELLIAVAVMAILAAVAYPSVMDSVRKGRRSEAFAALAAMQQGQERWRSNNPNYSLQLADLGVSSPTRSGYYVLSAAQAASATLATGYVLTADGSSSSQVNDGQCAKLSVQVIAGQVAYGSCKSCSTFTYSAGDRCWSR